MPVLLAQRVWGMARQEQGALVRPVWGRVLKVHSGRVWEVNLAKSRPWNPQWRYLPGAAAFFFLAR